MLFYLTVITVVAFDQVSKYWIRTNMYLGQSIPEDGAAWLTLAHNTDGKLNWIFIANSIVITAIIFCYYYVKLSKKMPSVGLGLMLGGVAGNLLDRMLLGYVIDFINNDSLVFNIADTAFLVGVFIIISYACWRYWILVSD
jgi:signal peptidase II